MALPFEQCPDRSTYSPVMEDKYTCSSYFLPSSKSDFEKCNASDLTCLLSLNYSSMGNVSQYSQENLEGVQLYTNSHTKLSDFSLSSDSNLDSNTEFESTPIINDVHPSYGTSQPETIISQNEGEDPNQINKTYYVINKLERQSSASMKKRRSVTISLMESVVTSITEFPTKLSSITYNSAFSPVMLGLFSVYPHFTLNSNTDTCVSENLNDFPMNDDETFQLMV